MSKIPKISTKYDDLDSTFEGPESHSSTNEPIRQPSRSTRNPNPCRDNESSESDHDAESQESFISADENANETEADNQLSPSILEISSSNSSDNSQILSPTSHSEMSLTKQEIQDLINIQVQAKVSEFISTHQEQQQSFQHQQFEHAPKISNVPLLTMSNYADWEKKMRAAMSLNRLWIDPKIEPSEYTAAQKVKSIKAVQFIVMHLNPSNNVHVTTENEECFHTVWKTLKDFHKPNTPMALCDFYCSLQHLIHRPGDCVRTHLMALEQHFNKLADVADKLPESHKVAVVLASVRKSPEFSNLFTSAKWLKTESLTFSTVRDTIISTQDQLRMETHSNATEAHATQHKFSNRPSQSHKSLSRPHNRKPRDPVKGWSCTRCQMDNHTNSTCYKNPSNRATSSSVSQNNNRTQHSHVVFDDGQEEVNMANVVNFGTYTIDNGVRQSRSSVKLRLDNSRTASPYANISPYRRSEVDTRADDDVDLRLLEYEEPNDDDNSLSSIGNKNLKIHDSNISLVKFQLAKKRHRINTKLYGKSSWMLHESTYRSPPKPPKINHFMNSNFFCLQTDVKSELFSLNKTMKSHETSTWIIDSGATIHMCNDSSVLENFIFQQGHFVTISNGISIEIKGFGDLKFSILDRDNVQHAIILRNVAFVPQLMVNLISVRALTGTGATVSFTQLSCIMSKSNVSIKLGSLINSAYVMRISHRASAQRMTNNSFLCIHQWHKRLGHRNLDQIRRIKDILNIKVSKCNCSDDCLSCIRSKICVQTFPKQSRKPDHPRELITSDLCGELRTQSLGGSKYFITFNCAATDYTEVVSIRNKSDCKREVIRFMEKCLTQFGSYPKTFRSDRGGEYLDSELQDFLKSKGIKFQCTVANSPQQNGISERKNRTLMEAVRTILLEKKLPENLWAEALYHANATFNSIPKINETKSPYEKYFNKRSEFQFLEFGTQVVFKSNKQNLSKLTPKGELGVFVGFDENSKGYRVYSNGKIQIRRNVKFLTQPESSTTSHDILHNNDTTENNEEPVIVRRSERLKQQKSLLTTAQNYFEPRTYKQAVSCPDKEHWINAMKEELDSINSNKTWSKVELPQGRKAIGSKWVFKLKCNERGEIERYKARLVAQGFTQIYGTDYDEVFAPVARPTSFRVLLTIAGIQNLQVMQYDVKTAFLNGIIEEEIYLKPPHGLQNDTKVFRLHKSLYGLKQSARKWNEAIHDCLTNLNFKQSKHDNCLYSCNFDGDICFLIIHVDDILAAAKNTATIETLMERISQTFQLKCLGNAKQFLGINIHRRDDGLFEINQSTYINKIATTLQLEDSKGSLYPIDPGYFKLDGSYLDTNTEYRQIIGMLLYISNNSRPDISASVSILAQRVAQPRDIDLKESYRVVKYLLRTKDQSLRFGDTKTSSTLTAYTDANWAEDRTDRKSTSGFLCQVYGGLVSWSSKKQDVVAISTTESEYYALAETIREVNWLKELLTDFNIIVKTPVPIFMDSQSCLKMVTNEKLSNRTKHIAVRMQFAKDNVRTGKVQLNYIPTEDNIADMLTKPLAGTKIKYLRELALLK